MRHLISLQRRGRVADGYGGGDTTWTEYAEVWGEIVPASGKEQVFGQQLENPVTHKITVRYRTDILESDRAVYKTRNFNIRSALTVDERRRYITMMVEENVAP